MAQDYYPRAVTPPPTGRLQLSQDNHYMLILRADGAEMKPSSREINETAPNIAYTGFRLSSWWTDGTWEDLTTSTDSFVLDDQNRLSVAYSKDIWNYSSQPEKTKAKYVFTYNTSNQLERLDYLRAVNFNSNNYQKLSVTYYTYDPNGKLVLDSSIYNQQTRLTYYAYTGNHISTVTQLTESDSTRMAHYTWTGDLLKTSTDMTFNADADEWDIVDADTFDYNMLGQVTRHWGLGYVSRNGELTIEPVDNDSYTYTSDGQLLEWIDRQWTNGTWRNYAKTIITYDANNKAVEGFEYEYLGSDWSASPRVQYLFSIQAGLNAVANPLSEITIAPNPANDFVTIDLDKHAAHLNLFDITGKSVYEQTSVSGEHKIDVSALKNGVYYTTIRSEGFQRTAKIVVSH